VCQISLTTIAFIALQLRLGYIWGKKTQIQSITILLESFVSDWTLGGGICNLFLLGNLFTTHTIRYFGSSSNRDEKRTGDSQLLTFGDIPIIRERGGFTHANIPAAGFLEERRISLALVTDVVDHSIFPCFTLIFLSDEAYAAVPLDERKSINLGYRYSPLLLFICLLNHAVQLVCESWVEVLRRLDAELSVKVSRIRQIRYNPLKYFSSVIFSTILPRKISCLTTTYF
jgi:hypothetical protein